MKEWYRNVGREKNWAFCNYQEKQMHISIFFSRMILCDCFYVFILWEMRPRGLMGAYGHEFDKSDEEMCLSPFGPLWASCKPAWL